MSDSKAALRKKSLIRPRRQDADGPEAADQDRSTDDSDWGFSEGSAKLPAQTMMFLAATLFLVGAAGYYAWQKFLAPPAAASSAENKEPGGEGLPVARINGGKPEEDIEENSDENYGGNFGNPENAETPSPTGETDNEFGFVQGEPVTDEHFPADGGADSAGGYPFEQPQPSEQMADQNAGAPENPFGESSHFTGADRPDDVDPTYGIPSDQNYHPPGSQDQFEQPRGSAAGHSGVTQSAEDQFFPAEQREETPADPFNQTNGAAPQEMVQSEPVGTQPVDSPTGKQETFPAGHKIPGISENPRDLTRYQQHSPDSEPEPRQFAADEADETAEPVQGLFGGPVDESQFSQSPPAQDNGGAEFTDNYSPHYSSGVTADTGFMDTSGDRFDSGTAGTVRHVDPTNESFSSASSPFGTSTRRQAEYEIQPEDSYWTISKKVYGTARYFLALSRYNEDRIPDTKRMRPGVKILTPPAEELEAKSPDLFPKRRQEARPFGKSRASALQTGAAEESGFFRNREGRPAFRVGENDTLSGIARDHLGRASRWVQVYEMNRDVIPDPDSLKIGTVLRLPADASNVQLVRTPPEDR